MRQNGRRSRRKSGGGGAERKNARFYAGKRAIMPVRQKKLKIFEKSCCKRLTFGERIGIIFRLYKTAMYGLRREVTENSGQKAGPADNFR